MRAFVFDVGETLVDETRIWSDWADWLGIPRLTFMAGLGGLIERGGAHLDPLRMFVPGIDIKAEFAKRADAGVPDDLRVDDLYPDAVPALRAVLADGYRVGIVGNQPTRAEAVFNGLGMALDFVASSASWGVAKPDPAFFARVATELGLPQGGHVILCPWRPGAGSPAGRDRLRRRSSRQRRPSGRGRRDGRDLHPSRGVGLDPGRPGRSAGGGCDDREPERAAGGARCARVASLGRNPLPRRRAVRPDRHVAGLTVATQEPRGARARAVRDDPSVVGRPLEHRARPEIRELIVFTQWLACSAIHRNDASSRWLAARSGAGDPT